MLVPGAGEAGAGRPRLRKGAFGRGMFLEGSPARGGSLLGSGVCARARQGAGGEKN